MSPKTFATTTATPSLTIIAKKTESIVSNSSKNNNDNNGKIEKNEINTEDISKKLNELLKSNKFSFNDLKSMFDVSYQTMEDILYKPKHWSLLSQRIKIVYMKISNYFNNSSTENYLNDTLMNDTESNYSNSSYNEMRRRRSSSFDEIGKESKRQRTERVNNKEQPMIEYDVESAQSINKHFKKQKYFY